MYLPVRSKGSQIIIWLLMLNMWPANYFWLGAFLWEQTGISSPYVGWWCQVRVRVDHKTTQTFPINYRMLVTFLLNALGCRWWVCWCFYNYLVKLWRGWAWLEVAYAFPWWSLSKVAEKIIVFGLSEEQLFLWWLTVSFFSFHWFDGSEFTYLNFLS